jgi:hypothetical protein
LGAPLKGVLWECTAVAEIRVQARALSAKLIASLVGQIDPALSATSALRSLPFAGVPSSAQISPSDVLWHPRAFFAAQ